MLIITIVFSSCNGGESDIDEWQKEHFGNIQFKGKIINMAEYVRNGHYYDIACVQLDYSNVDSFYAFLPGKSFLKIAHGKAVMPIGSGVSLEDKKIDYVEVNINNSGKEIFYHKGDPWYKERLSLGSPGLLASDLQFCDELGFEQ